MQRRLAKMNELLEGSDDEAILKAFEFTPRAEALTFFNQNIQAQLIKKDSPLSAAVEQTRGQDILNRCLFTEWHGFLPDHNLNYTDKAAMVEGVEVRVPFTDPRLMAFAATIPPNLKCTPRQAKHFLKKALGSRLPTDVLYRSKAGFGAPIRQWLAAPVGQSFAREVLFNTDIMGLFDSKRIGEVLNSAKRYEGNSAYTLLSIIMISLWISKFHKKYSTH